MPRRHRHRTGSDAATVVHGHRRPGHEGRDRIAGGEERPRGSDRAASRQPPARLPGLRQGRRVPVAGPDVQPRAGGEPLRRGEAPLREADPDQRPRPPRPGALHPVRPLHPLRRRSRRRCPDPLHPAWQRDPGDDVPRPAVQLLLLGQHRADLPGRRADGDAVPVQGAAVGPRRVGVDVHHLLGRLPDDGAVESRQPRPLSGSRQRRRQLGVAVRPGPLQLRGGQLHGPRHRTARAQRCRRAGPESRFTETSWTAALAAVAKALRTTIDAGRAKRIALLGGARGTNEDAFAWAQLADAIGIEHRDAQLGDGLPAELLDLPRATDRRRHCRTDGDPRRPGPQGRAAGPPSAPARQRRAEADAADRAGAGGDRADTTGVALDADRVRWRGGRRGRAVRPARRRPAAPRSRRDRRRPGQPGRVDAVGGGDGAGGVRRRRRRATRRHRAPGTAPRQRRRGPAARATSTLRWSRRRRHPRGRGRRRDRHPLPPRRRPARRLPRHGAGEAGHRSGRRRRRPRCVPHRVGGARRRRPPGVDVRREERHDDQPRRPGHDRRRSGSPRQEPRVPTGWSPPSSPTCSASTIWRRPCRRATRSPTPSPRPCRPTPRRPVRRWRTIEKASSPSPPRPRRQRGAGWHGGRRPQQLRLPGRARPPPVRPGDDDGDVTVARPPRRRRRRPRQPRRRRQDRRPGGRHGAAHRRRRIAARCRCDAIPECRGVPCSIPFNRGSDINSIVDATAGATDVRIEVEP